MRAPSIQPLTADIVAAHPRVVTALTHVRETDAATLDDMRAVVAIPAPSFAEASRAEWMRERLRAAGATDLAIDEVGNVLGRLPGCIDGAPLLIAAHLDTVFPADTPLVIREDGERISAPGIADNARGLAALIALARALSCAGVATRRPIVFAATVGEEGIGDLRGVKHLFRDGSSWRAAAGFIALDGTGHRRIVHRAIGSRRLRFSLSGPGGHSWADRGIANPIHAAGTVIARLAAMPLPDRPAASLTVARVAGGTSINTIPDSIWFELDLRSDDGAQLGALESRVLEVVEACVRDANEQRRSGSAPIVATHTVIGDRPTGQTPLTSPLVRAARAATRYIGEQPELVASSTDANTAISIGLPAIAIGAGGISGGTHTPGEWYANDGGPAGIQRALITAVAFAGLAGDENVEAS
jgi:acetylornithine deacetylase/succinyl-diaminopimelate desuccinylase-like protein